MALEPSKPLQQAKIPAGTILFQADTPALMLCLLHQGEAKAYSKVGGKKSLYSIGANSSPGFRALLQQKSYMVTYITTKESVVSAFPVKKGSFSALILGKLNVGMLAARSLLQESIQSYNIMKKYSSFLSMIQRSNDNLGIAYSKCNPSAFESNENSNDSVMHDPVIPAAKFTLGEFKQNGGEVPESFTREWLQSDHSNLLRKIMILKLNSILMSLIFLKEFYLFQLNYRVIFLKQILIFYTVSF